MIRPGFISFVLNFVVLGCLAGKPDLYCFIRSPPCRLVFMTANILGIEMNIKTVDLNKKEQMTPEYLKLNPEHTVPTLNDDGFVLAESRAIAEYLCETRPNGEKLYPKDPKERALVNQMLYFDATRLYKTFEDTYKQLAFGNPFDKTKLETLDEAYGMLEEFLTRNQWAAGDQMSLADLSLLSTVSTIDASDFDMSRFPKVTQWFAKAKAAIPDYQTTNQDGVEVWKGMIAKAKQ